MKLDFAKLFGLVLVCGALFFTACDLSFLFEKEQKSSLAGFATILARVQPIYKKTIYNESNSDVWLEFKNDEHEWYLYSDERYLLSSKFAASLNRANIEARSKPWIEEHYANVKRAHLLLEGELTGAETGNPTDYPDHFERRTYKESVDLIHMSIASDRPQISSYVLGDAITIKLPETNPRNHHVMPEKKVVHSETATNFAFVAVLEGHEGTASSSTFDIIRRGPYAFHMKDQFVLIRTHMDVYSPQDRVVFKEIIFALNDKASLIRFHPNSSMISSHVYKGQNLILTMADYTDLTTSHTGHLFDAVIRAEDGTIRSVDFSINP